MYTTHEISEQEHQRWLESLRGNPAVINMHLKFGFQQEGLRRQNILKDGQRIDVVLLGITKAEWQSKRPTLEPLIARLGR